MKDSEPGILIDARESGTSTGRYVDKLVENLSKLEPNYQITLLAHPQRVEFLKKLAPGFKIIKTTFAKGTFGEQYGFVWQLYGIKNNLVHFGQAQQPLLYFGNSVTTIHDLTTVRFRNPAANRLVFGAKQVVYKRLVKRVVRKSSHIITPSEYVKADVAQYAKIDPAKIIVTHEAADRITEPAKEIIELAGQKFIMYVGRAQPHKNLWRLVEAFQLMQESHPELKLVLAGRKDILYQRLERKIAKKKISGVVVAGFVSEAQLRWLYENCQAYVFPSLSEGFGLPALEAMMHGAPVASSNATCLPEIYGKAAAYFDPKGIDDMAQNISRILDNEKLRQELIDRGKKQAAKYSWRRMAEQTLEVYKKASSKNT